MRRLAAVWFADIVGYTALSSRDEASALSLAALLREIASGVVLEHDGRVVKFIGDAALAVFPGVEAAVESGLEVASRFAERASEVVQGGGALRVGIHMGEVAFSEDDDVYGDVVNVAARIQAESEPGATMVSEDVWRQLRRRPRFAFESAGSRSLRGISEPMSVWTATFEYVAAPAVPTREVPAEVATRRSLVVLPFRMLRPDPEVAFLAFGIPDAVAVSLMGNGSVAVRSPATVVRHADAEIDLEAFAREASVDLVLSGSVLRADDKVRVTAQLAEGSRGTLIWSDTTTVTMGDLFSLQDDLVHRIVGSVASPLAGDASSAASDVPASSEAYTLFLRANQVSVQYGDWSTGIELYRRALDRDPDFAPAWARLGRCHRLRGKYGLDAHATEAEFELAEGAFDRALELNPELDLAHNLRAQHDVEAGHPIAGMVRLLRRARQRPPQVDLFVGLTHACRYCGLLEASKAVHELAVTLDPGAVTSIGYTLMQLGEHDRAVADSHGEAFLQTYALHSLGRLDEAMTSARRALAESRLPSLRLIAEAMLAGLRGDASESLERGGRAVAAFPDPEGRYYMARLWSALGAVEPSLALLEQIVDAGFACAVGLRGDPMFDALRAETAFGALVERAEALTAAGVAAFRAEGGPSRLGLRARDVSLAS
jgi:class 3 adenylate cyclase/tetratricopeptide (TPR) repeat protein